MSAKNIKVNKCIICDHDVYEITDKQIKVDDKYVVYDVCTHCGFTKKQAAFFVDLKEEKRQYDFHQNTLENEGYVTYLNRFIDESVIPFITSGLALDFGCGPGPVLSHLLKSRGFNVSIYDPIYHNNPDVLNQKYDVITSTEVFEHFYNPISSIEAVLNSLKTSGFLVIMTSFKTMDDQTFLNWWYRRDVTHVSFYTEKAFERIASHFSLTKIYTNHKNIIVFRKEG